MGFRRCRYVLAATLLATFAAGAAGPADSDDMPPAGLPDSLIELGTGGSSYAIVVDKSQSSLDIYHKLDDGAVVRVRSFQASTGLNGGDKRHEGDQRTPEGIYYFIRIREDDELLSEYGIRAFDLNYPNELDRILGKEGSGIWLHATDEPERLLEPRSSRGCVVVSNDDIREISRYITLYRTPIVITDRSSYNSPAELGAARERIQLFVRSWLDSWASQDFERYSRCYSDGFRGGGERLRAWMRRKRAVFQATTWAGIDVADIKIMRCGNYYAISFYQRYRSNLMDDTGIKSIYVVEEADCPGIVGEEWHPVGYARSGSSWHQGPPRLSAVVSDLAEVELDAAGRLALASPQMRLPLSDAGGRRRGAARTAAPVVAAEAFQITGAQGDRIAFSMRLSKVSRDASIRRGWMFLVARWGGQHGYTVFPDAPLRDGRPVAYAAGDRYGIRWFKIVEGTIERPAHDATLQEIRCLVFSAEGELLVDSVLATGVS